MASGVWRGTSSPSFKLFRAKSASGVSTSSHGAHPRSIQLRFRASSSVSFSLGPNFSRKVSSTGNSSELKQLTVKVDCLVRLEKGISVLAGKRGEH